MQRNCFAACAQFAPNSRALRASRETACGKLSKHLRANEKVCDERWGSQLSEQFGSRQESLKLDSPRWFQRQSNCHRLLAD